MLVVCINNLPFILIHSYLENNFTYLLCFPSISNKVIILFLMIKGVLGLNGLLSFEILEGKIK